MKEAILYAIAFIFATAYNIVLMVTHMSSADSKLQTTSALLTVFNTVKDVYVLIVILSKIFL